MINAISHKTMLTIKTDDKDFSVSKIASNATTDGLYAFANAVNTLQEMPIVSIIKVQEFMLVTA